MKKQYFNRMKIYVNKSNIQVTNENDQITNDPIQIPHFMENEHCTSNTTHQMRNDIWFDVLSTHGTGHTGMRQCMHSYQHSALHFGTKYIPPQCNSGMM
jgi:hypothetical protein